MKKKTKIILSILGVFIILIAASAAFLGSQGFFRYAKSPEIESIGFADDNPVSFKDVQAARDEDIEMFGNSPEEVGDSYLCLENSGIEYIYEITFTDGTVQKVSSLERYPLAEDGMHTMYISAYVSYNTFVAAKNEGKDTVPVEIEAEIYKADYDPAAVDTYSGTAEKKYTDAIVEEIEPLFDTPLTANGYDYGLENKQFIVKYADGTEKTLSPEIVEEKNISAFYCNRYSLDGSPLSYYVSSSDVGTVLVVRYLDSKMELDRDSNEENAAPVEKIELRDYSFSTGNELSEITYTVTKSDGETVDFTSALNEKGYFDSSYFEGYLITAQIALNHKADKIIVVFRCNEFTETAEIDAPEKISRLDTINFEYLGAVFFAFLQGIFA